MNLKQAVGILKAANEWPRCGEGWPASEEEEAAAKLLVGRNAQGQTPEEAAACVAYEDEENRRAAAARREKAEARAALLAKAAAEAADIPSFARITGGATMEEIINAGRGWERRHVFIHERDKKTIRILRSGLIVPTPTAMILLSS